MKPSGCRPASPFSGRNLQPSSKTMTKELPEEILVDIFSRLPAKSVGKCRCLSTRWQSLLSSPEFVESHLNKTPQPETLILFSRSGIHSISPFDNTSRTLQLGSSQAVFSGSVNGLVLLLRGKNEDELFLANPTTLQQVKIPDSPLALKDKGIHRRHGFGYDSCGDDYKIVMLSLYVPYLAEHERDRFGTFVDVYSLKMGAWRRVGTSPYDHDEPFLSSGAFVNGCVHWMARSSALGYPSVIAAFEVVREVFDEVPAPDGVDMEKFEFIELTVLGGCLCMLAGKRGGEMDVWIMKEYGLSDSWMKFSIDTCNLGRALWDVSWRWDVIRPLCFVGNEDDVVLVIGGYGLLVYDREKETFRDMVVDVCPMIGGIGTYVQSLVSPTIG